MDVHIRTKINTWWSSIETAVIKIGDATMEITGGTDGGNYWLNGHTGKELKDGDILAFANFSVTFNQVTFKQKKYRFEFGHGDALSIQTYKDFVSVVVKANTATNFMGSVGLIGKFRLA
jgi:hypothetical protein